MIEKIDNKNCENEYMIVDYSTTSISSICNLFKRIAAIDDDYNGKNNYQSIKSSLAGFKSDLSYDIHNFICDVYDTIDVKDVHNIETRKLLKQEIQRFITDWLDRANCQYTYNIMYIDNTDIILVGLVVTFNN